MKYPLPEKTMRSGQRSANSCASAHRRPNEDPHVAAIGPTQGRKRLSERREARFCRRIVFVVRHEHADAPQAVALLRPRGKRPSRRAAEERDEVAAPDHSITSVARA
jgi:hypothetical protein